jgi:hypothetical protein
MTALKVEVLSLLVVFQHALGGHDSRNHNDWHGADHSCKKEIFENRKQIVDHKIHDFSL